MRSGRGIRYRRSIWESSGGEENRGSKVLRWDPSDILIGCPQDDTIKPTKRNEAGAALVFLFCGLEKAKIGNEPV